MSERHVLPIIKKDPGQKPPRVEIQLAGDHRHGLPRLVRVNEAWVVDQNTLELEAVTQQGQIVVIPLDGHAMFDLHALLGRALEMAKKPQGPKS